MAHAWVYKSGSVPLIPYLLDNRGKTVTEALIETGVIPDIRPAGFLRSGS